MASLKEIKARIASVNSTKKITEARQRISSAQLRRAQTALQWADDFRVQIDHIAARLHNPDQSQTTALTEEHDTGRIVVVMLSSNSGMCGAFNAKMAKEIERVKQRYADDTVEFIPVGKKIGDALRLQGYLCEQQYDGLLNKTDSEQISVLASSLASRYMTGNCKRIIMIYYHLKNTVVQQISEQQLLPYTFADKPAVTIDYIFEPGGKQLLEAIVPLAVYARLYALILDHIASEHGARTVAMQLATENADKLLDLLHLTYNKARQQNITSELLDIVGGLFA